MNLIIDLIKYGGIPPQYEGIGIAIWIFASVISLVFFVMYFHQFLYLIVGTLFKSGRKIAKTDPPKSKLGVVISARNERNVIGNLIESIRQCDYPQELLDIYVVADNCTDDTAQICRELGCHVYERFDLEHIGKGFALHFLFETLHTAEDRSGLPEAYVVLDADNLVLPNFFTEINKTYRAGYEIVSSYRNSKNFGKNWITSGYGFWFMHESRHLNNSRMLFHSSCAISGTGFLISRKVVEEFDNWNFFCLTEDIQCSTSYSITNRKVGYCHAAELYDEQPETFKQSYRQRERWAKGFYQVFGMSGGKLILGTLKGNFACWDILTTIFPAIVVTMISLIGFPLFSLAAACMGDFPNAIYALKELGMCALTMYVILFIIGLLVLITEWKKIPTTPVRKILFLFTLPIFMVTYIPISVTAFFRKVTWKPIIHTNSVTLDDIKVKKDKKKKKKSDESDEEQKSA